MNSDSRIPSAHESGSQASAGAALKSLDATLHLLATLPAPRGLKDRVFAGMMAGPRKARVLEWPQPLYSRDWVRGIAAAAIVLAVGSGGWGLYSHVKPSQPARAVTAPHTMFQSGGFSSAEMIRRPQTLNGPPVKKAEPAVTAKAKTAEDTAAKKPAHKPARTFTADADHAVKTKPLNLEPGRTVQKVTK
ncbi:MAG TPA: hypothetical protein VN579_01500 [Bryobacteraceae bacterium]|nr:hypothetical protein [Bryobacteraceae bacterium]